MNIKKIMAIFQKTFKDMLKNKRTLLMFLIFPIMTLVFYNLMPGQKEFFSTIFIPIHLILVPASLVASIISEEKEKNTLRSLILSNVKPLEYFLGIGIFVLLISILSSSLFLIVMNLTSIELVRFFIMVTLSVLCSMVVGSVIGIIADNQMSANALIMPVSIILGIVPMFSAFNDTIKTLSSYIYTQTLSNVIASIGESILFKDYLIMIVNFIVCLIIFTLVYRKKKLDN